jgi:hypothetical protein
VENETSLLVPSIRKKLSGSSLEGYRLPVLPTLPPFKARLVTTEEAKSGSLIGL